MKNYKRAIGTFQLFGIVFFMLISKSSKAQVFTVTAAPQSLTVYPGETNVPVTISVASDSFTGPVNVTLSGLPSGVTISSAPQTLTPGSSGTIMLNIGVNADQEAFPGNSAGNANSVLNQVTVIGAVGSVIATSTLNLTVSLSNPDYHPTNTTLPILSIDTGGIPIISKSTKISGTVTITSADGQISYLPNSSNSDNTATFHLHGNSTLSMPKKAYTMKLSTSLDLLNTMGLSCPYVTGSGKSTCDKSKSYVLLANYDDKTLLRDWSAFALANAIPYTDGYIKESPVPSPYTGVIPTPSGTSTLMPWAPHSLFVELYLNGMYEGVYQLTEKINVDSHRVNIDELEETNATGDITGGYLLEIDQHADEAFVFHTPQGLSIGLIDPDFSPDPEVPEQTNYISQYVNTAETALFSDSFTDPTQGWRAYFDEAAAINFYLVNEIMGNVDGGDFYSSVYLYKAADNPFIYMGPVWDFDISSGNGYYAIIANPTVPWMQTQSIWYKQWFKDPAFKADVITQFNALKNNGVLSTWLASIAAQATNLEQAQINNFNRWPILGIRVWPNPQAEGSYAGEVAYLTNYLNLRIAYLDSLFNGKLSTSTSLSASASTAYLGSPVTLIAQVTGGQSPGGIVSFSAAHRVIGTATLDSTGSATLVTNNFPLGSYPLEATYNGDSTNALSISSSKPMNVVPPLVGTVTSLADSGSSLSPGESVTFSVAVIGNSGSTAPTGSVTFTSNGSTIGTAALTTSGTASYAFNGLPTGNHTIQAIYSGDPAYSGSASNIVSVNVAVPQTITFANPGAQSYGATPTLTATASSGLTVAFTSSTMSVCTITSGVMLKFVSTGTCTINANQAGDGTYSAAPEVTQSFTVNKAVLTVTAANATKVYGTTNPSFTGSVTGQQNNDTFTENYTTAADVSSTVGTYSIVPSLTGTNLGYYEQAITNGTLTVTQAGSSISLSVSSDAITPGQSVTLSAVVASATTGTPTGAVSFYDGATLLGTESLAGGAAMYATSALAPGATHILTAAYDGNTNFMSSSTASALTVAVSPLDFTMALTGAVSQTVAPGGSVDFTFNLSPLYGSSSEPVSFTIAGLPAGAAAVFSPSTIVANGGPQVVRLTITAPTTMVQNHTNRNTVLFALLLLPLWSIRKHRGLTRLLCLLLVTLGGAAATSVLTGCGTSNRSFGRTPQSYNVTITATSGMLQHSSTVTLVVK